MHAVILALLANTDKPHHTKLPTEHDAVVTVTQIKMALVHATIRTRWLSVGYFGFWANAFIMYARGW